MGWLTGAVCALIAIVALYKFVSSGTKNNESKDRKARSGDILQADGREQSRKRVVVEKSSLDTPVVPLVAHPSLNFDTGSPAPSTASLGKPQTPAATVSIESAMAMPPPPPPQMVTNTASSRSMSPPRLKPPIVGPTPPRPGGFAGGALRPPPSAAASLRVPPQKVLQNTSMQPASSTLAPAQKKGSRQVILAPGHSPMDWAALTADPDNNLRGKDAPPQLARVTPSQLRAQNGRKGKDAWTVYQGKVYNITPYVPFHPGGKGEILRGAAKDSAKLFMEVHPWVNWDGMLAECMVGILVGEEVTTETNELDEMD